MLALCLVLVAALLAAVSDLRTRRIPNALVVALFAAGLVLSAFLGWQHLVSDLAITLATLLIGTFAFAAKLLGGGDVKLLAAATGALGYPGAIALLLYTFLCGGVIAVAYSAVRGELRAALANVRSLALPLFAGITPARLDNGTPMPYALAIFAGALLTALTNGLVPHLRLLW